MTREQKRLGRASWSEADVLAERERVRAWRAIPGNNAKERAAQAVKLASETGEQRQRRLAGHRAYHAQHREARLEANKRWAVAHPERRRELDRLCAAKPAQKRKQLARHKQWRDKNRNVLREYARRRIAQMRATYVEKVDYRAIFKEADGKCGICEKPLDLFGYNFDHIIPLAAGGSHTRENIQVTHEFCNKSKGAKVKAA